MKQDILLKARKQALDEYLTEGDDAWEEAEKAIDIFLDKLEELHITQILVDTPNDSRPPSVIIDDNDTEV